MTNTPFKKTKERRSEHPASDQVSIRGTEKTQEEQWEAKSIQLQMLRKRRLLGVKWTAARAADGSSRLCRPLVFWNELPSCHWSALLPKWPTWYHVPVFFIPSSQGTLGFHPKLWIFSDFIGYLMSLWGLAKQRFKMTLWTYICTSKIQNALLHLYCDYTFAHLRYKMYTHTFIVNTHLHIWLRRQNALIQLNCEHTYVHLTKETECTHTYLYCEHTLVHLTKRQNAHTHIFITIHIRTKSCWGHAYCGKIYKTHNYQCLTFSIDYPFNSLFISATI